MRADFLDEVVWGQVTALLADPTLVQAELDRRLAELRTANPATAERGRIDLELTAVMSPSAAPKLVKGVWPPASAKAAPAKKAAAAASKTVTAKASPSTVTKAPPRRSIEKASASKSTAVRKTPAKKQ